MAILYVRIDLAKNAFAVNDVNNTGKSESVRASLPRVRLHELIAAVSPCMIGVAACRWRSA
jgi:transposase